MIRFDDLESRLELLHAEFCRQDPFEAVVIDDFADPDELMRLYEGLPDPMTLKSGKSRDYMFARNKYEKSAFREISPACEELYRDLLSERFQRILERITGQQVFVDPAFHGGGLHQGGPGSFLDMHVDFNFHPLNDDWFRNLNILLYVNPGWRPEYRGQLKLRNARTGATREIDPIFNRCVIMYTRDYTLHGYDPIAFPPRSFRRSIATYAYSLDTSPDKHVRSTQWAPEKGSFLKRWIGQHWPVLVRLKNKALGSGTARNK